MFLYLTSRVVRYLYLCYLNLHLYDSLIPALQLYRRIPLSGLRLFQDTLPAARVRRRSRAMADVLVRACLCRRC